MHTEGTSALRPVVEDLRRIFGPRLEAVVAYGRDRAPVPSLALVSSLAIDDLNACAERAAAWRRAGAATPLLLTRHDFIRSLDAFPIEYGEIIANHVVVHGQDPFDGLAIRTDDLRRACEVQAKSHLLHLREDYLESGARPGDVDALVRDSASGLAALLRHLARLDGAPAHTASDLIKFAAHRIGLDANVVGDLLTLDGDPNAGAVDGLRLFPAYLAAMERLAEFTDRWREA